MKSDSPRILAIETSCDDTSVACLEGMTVASSVVSSQLDGAKFGGIVPELASRAHQANIVHVVRRSLAEASWEISQVDVVGVTYAPGLLGSLFVGLNFAKGLAYGRGIPMIGVHHLEGHVLAPFLTDNPPTFPYIALVVSGGHTQLLMVRAIGSYELLGTTVDDAAGECYDKVARFLKLDPQGRSSMAGPMVDERASSGRADAVDLPRPMLSSPELNFSFSGLKTAVLNFIKGRSLNDLEVNDLCASFQEAVTDVLLHKTMKACQAFGVDRIVVTGGVAANSRLRTAFADAASRHGLALHIPPVAYCTDNAAMIGITAFFHWQRGEQSGLDLVPRATMVLDHKT
ncbi:MAG: tRNA (adenosine(37)-N6)-threonylcarbamoyltransferase complex transferase subunit TsaD [Bacteroidetes bacterium]|nr:tRNA (adenosine(37)-N6)-threonylcarbamoyltransferase complex transferase subunit TsaD [Bacteroidota bacterium]